LPTIDPPFLRSQLIGADARIETPFGERLMVYGDYTASGRCLMFVERYLRRLQHIYANTHTEDDLSGRAMTRLLHQAEERIKQSVNAGPGGRIIAVGTGATGAIDKLQQIIGLALPPATRRRLDTLMAEGLGTARRDEFLRHLAERQPVVFVGPYEHHSNEISWRQNLATVVEVGLDGHGGLDLAHLESLLGRPAYRGRMLIGSFSAASNVTGMRSPVHDIAALMHRHGGLACFDYAACAPYVDIDMAPADATPAHDTSLDAVFLSPHKFLGGPGSSGILVFKERLYDRELPPSVSAGGTVDYVSPHAQDFIEQIEDREKAGTPGVLQTLKAALAFQVKDEVTVPVIEAREHELMQRAFQRFAANPRIEVLGNPDPCCRIGIISFIVAGRGDRKLHPKFVTTLLNDLFGIQTRAGCSCAGPYGHRLLGIDDDRSDRYRELIRGGWSGLKPGWCRVSLHYVMDDLETDYLLDAIEFVADHGVHFLPLYLFDVNTGNWEHRDNPAPLPDFSLQEALETGEACTTTRTLEERRAAYREALEEARTWADKLAQEPAFEERVFEGEAGRLQFFTLPVNSCNAGVRRAG
jgi:selenocysteine lyase/cysteine desulfurase